MPGSRTRSRRAGRAGTTRPAARAPGTAAPWPGTPRRRPAPHRAAATLTTNAATPISQRRAAADVGGDAPGHEQVGQQPQVHRQPHRRRPARPAPGPVRRTPAPSPRAPSSAPGGWTGCPPAAGRSPRRPPRSARPRPAGSPGRTPAPGRPGVEVTIADRLVEPTRTDSAKIATSRVGSTSARMVISRLAPIPPNAVPVSMPARPAPPCRARAARRPRTGRPPGRSADAVVTNGAIDGHHQRHGAPAAPGRRGTPRWCRAGVIGCLRSSLRRSRHGCPTPGPGPALHAGPGPGASGPPAAGTARDDQHCLQRTAERPSTVIGSPPARPAARTRCRSRSPGSGARCRSRAAARPGPTPPAAASTG